MRQSRNLSELKIEMENFKKKRILPCIRIGADPFAAEKDWNEIF
jgi:hypothetical protein